MSEPLQLFFDVDGVLIQGWHADPALRRPWHRHLQKDLGIDPDLFERAYFFAKQSDGKSHAYHCARGDRDMAEVLAELLPNIGSDVRPAEFMAYWFEQDARLDKNLWQVIESLKCHPELRFFVATNQERHRAHYLWQKLGFKNHFEALFSSCELGCTKHEVAFFRKVEQRLNLPTKASCLLIDDTPEVLEVAASAGWQTLHYRSREDLFSHPSLKPWLS